MNKNVEKWIFVSMLYKSAIGNAANLHLLWYQNKKGFAPRDECVLPVLYTVTQL